MSDSDRTWSDSEAVTALSSASAAIDQVAAAAATRPLPAVPAAHADAATLPLQDLPAHLAFARHWEQHRHEFLPRAVIRACPLCGGSDRWTWFTSQDGYRYDVCRTCEMIHVPEFVPLAVWDDYYQSLPAARDFLRSQLAQSVGQHAMQRDSERFGRYLAMLRAHGVANANSRLLDIGSYTGAWPRLARAAGVDAHGVEGLAEAVQFAQSREPELPLLHARVEEFDPASFGGAFDVVTMWETLEHTRDPLAALRRAAMALKPGGMLAVSVPNAANPQFTILGSFCFYAYGGYHYTGHINMFSPHTLRKALAACGFDVIEVNSEYGTDWRQVVHYLRRQFDRIHCYRNLLSQGAIATVTEPGLDVILNWLSPALTRLENAWTAGPIMLALARRR